MGKILAKSNLFFLALLPLALLGNVLADDRQKKICFTDLQLTDPNFEIPKSSFPEKTTIDKCPESRIECPRGQGVPPLIVISLDGFRADYLLRNMTPNLAKMRSCGASTDYMRAMFPTKTFPNHYTLVTGLYPESHGIIDNSMFDLETNRTFSLKTEEVYSNHWYKGEPIWNTATKAGKKVVTMWPGGAVDVQDVLSEWCYRYNKKVTYASKIEEVLRYFNPNQTTHPDAAFIYIEQPDAAGHKVGPYGDWVAGNLTIVDNLIGYLVNGMKDRGYGNCVNYVIVADHGMQRVDCKHTLNLTAQLPLSDYFLYTGSHARISSKYFLDTTNLQFTPIANPVPVEETMAALQCSDYNNTLDWNVRFYKKEDLPKRFHYSNNPLIDDIVLDLEPNFVAERFSSSKCSVTGGSHGADNTYKSMHALFAAMGSGVQDQNLEPFENIELYNLFADLMKIPPASTNGTYGVLFSVLKDKPLTKTTLPNPSTYLNCTVPDTESEKSKRREKTKLPKLPKNCFKGNTEDKLDDLLKLSPQEAGVSTKRHLPLGTVGAGSQERKSCLLLHRDYISSFNKELQLPLWSSFTLDYFAGKGIKDSNVLKGKPIWSKDGKGMTCLRGDVRVDNAVDHRSYEDAGRKIEKTFLFPPGFIQKDQQLSDAYLLSNVVPMFTSFKNGIWKDTMTRVEEYAEKYQSINVVMGPIFDYNADGLADSMQDILCKMQGNNKVVIPTHYFISVKKLSSPKNETSSSSDLLTLILPHTPKPHSCWDKRKEQYARELTARLRDVELLTGLTFLTKVTDPSSRAMAVTRLNEQLWKGWNWLEDSAGEHSKAAKCPPGYRKERMPLLLISIDSFRPDYLDLGVTPTLKKLYSDGTNTKLMQSMFPTLTFPNHYSIVTGLYPESHGIIDNKMYDPSTGSYFSLGRKSMSEPHWWIGEPLWVRVEKEKKTAMSYFWPGSDVLIHDTRPSEYRVYDGQTPNSVRVATVLDWLSNGTGKLPDLVTIYFGNVDEGGHDSGPASLRVQEELRRVDEVMGELMDGLMRIDLISCVNIVVVSDHGMGHLPPGQNVKLDEILTPSQRSLTYMYEGASSRISTEYSFPSSDHIIPENKRIKPEEIVAQINSKHNNHSLVAFTKTSLAKRYHYCNSRRIDEVILLVKENWLAVRHTPWNILGNHGWDAFYSSMQSLFIGWGQAFKQSTHYEQPFENIELYNLLSHILGITPGPNNGTWGSLHHFLRDPPPLANSSTPPPPTSCLFPREPELGLRSNFTSYSCPEVTYDFQKLKKTEKEKAALMKRHVSTGITDTHNDNCILHQDDFVSSFDKKTKLPKWVSFFSNSSYAPSTSPSKLIPDVRLEIKDQYNCSQWNDAKKLGYHRVPLFNYGGDDTGLMSHMVPMRQSFLTELIKSLIKSVGGNCEVIVGPVFDYDSDGLADDYVHEFAGEIAIPSHFFIIVLPVQQNTSEPNFNSLAFVLPNSLLQPTEYFKTVEEIVLENKVRLRDVELLTGLRFYSNYENQQHSVRSRTFITRKSWKEVFGLVFKKRVETGRKGSGKASWKGSGKDTGKSSGKRGGKKGGKGIMKRYN